MTKQVKDKIRQAGRPPATDPASVAIADAEKKDAAKDKAMASKDAPARSWLYRCIGDGEEARSFYAIIVTVVVIGFAIAVYFNPAEPGHSGTALTFLIQVATALVAFVVGKSRRRS